MRRSLHGGGGGWFWTGTFGYQLNRRPGLRTGTVHNASLAGVTAQLVLEVQLHNLSSQILNRLRLKMQLYKVYVIKQLCTMVIVSMEMQLRE